MARRAGRRDIRWCSRVPGARCRGRPRLRPRRCAPTAPRRSSSRDRSTAPGRDLRVQSGDAFDVTDERVQTDYNQEQLAPPKRGMTPRQRITAAYRVTIANAKPESVSVDVRGARFGTWRVTESSLSAEKLSATEVRFRVSVPAGGEATLTYAVQAES